MGAAWRFGIAGAGIVLLGTFVLIGDQWRWFRQTFSWMSRRYGAIEKGLGILLDDSAKVRELKEGEPGFQEILEIIAERTPIERKEISGIHCGWAAGFNMGETSVTYEIISLRPKSGSPPNALATREAVEQWLHDARVRSLSHWGFYLVSCGVFLGVVSLIMQALGSRSC